ncbi:MAG: M3 family metallopeptidase [Hyphomonadaceae bacterium]
MFRTALFAFGAFAMPLAVVANPAQTTTAAQAFSNPFFEAKATKFGAPAFDRIRPEHFRPAFYEGMRQQRAEIEAIANAKTAPTFDNTILAMEKTGLFLDDVSAVFFNMTSANSSAPIRAIQREMGPVMAAHSDSIRLNPKLFARVQAVYDKRAALRTPEQRRLVERVYQGFVRSGAKLNTEQKARVSEINQRLSSLSTNFSQKVLADTNQFALVLETEADRAGLPQFFLDAALEAGRARGMPGKYVVTLSRSSVEPFLELSTNRAMREKAWRGWVLRGDNNDAEDTKATASEIVTLRQERAAILGYAHHAAFTLDDTMAKTPANVSALLNGVWEPAKAAVTRDAAEYLALAKSQGFTDDKLEPWDWRFYAEQKRRAKYNLNEDEVKPYFSLDAMLDAQFWVANQLFGLKFKEITGTVPVYHPDVRVWEVMEGDGRHIGLFYGDFFSRESKQGGAWMSSYQGQDRVNGNLKPMVVNVLNYTKAPAGKPTLLSYDDAETLFHEFGHGLHGLLSNVAYPSLAGTAVSRDFVEFPAQIYEHWLGQRQVLERFARHSDTGAAMPKELLDKVMAARNHDQGFATVEFLSSALVDMDVHSQPNLPKGFDMGAFEKESLARIGMPREIVMRHRPTHFGHIFSGGYSAGYYSYMWSEVLDADGFRAFTETGDIFNKDVAKRLRTYVYGAGNARDPAEAYRQYRGRDPDPKALLEMRGLADGTSGN